MSDPTTTKTDTIYEALKRANPSELADALRELGFAKMASTVKAAFTGVTGAATYNITTAAMKALATISGINLAAGENLPAARIVRSLRVTAATTATVVGSYAITDAGGTVVSPATSSAVGLAKLSDDGTTLTFASADVTAFVIEYEPMPSNDPSLVRFANIT
jgi:hypothetical protein